MKRNDFVALALKSPLHVMLGNTVLLTVTGRKSGRKIAVPVNYYREGNTMWILSRRDRTWWRNLLQGGQVALRLHGRDLRGLAETVLDEADVAAQLGEYIRHLPISARSTGVRVEGGIPNSDDLCRLAKERLFVKICII